MNKLFLMKNPELFQGEKFLNGKTKYFEGWYFKFTNGKDTISFIPGINVSLVESNAFIQVITNEKSYFVKYDISEFIFCFKPFYIKIGNNFFSKEKIQIDINDVYQNLKVIGTLKCTNLQNLDTNIFSPNIMGPFSYIPNMECNHAILSMKNIANGKIIINNKNLFFRNGIGYIEKDWGCSFPKSYIWCQANNFKRQNASFMFSTADIPFGFFEFKGLICVLIIDDKEFKFTTYNNSKLKKYNISENEIDISLQHNSYVLNIKSCYNKGNQLFAPVKGTMKREIFESVDESIMIELQKNNKVIFKDMSKNCGLEVAR